MKQKRLQKFALLLVLILIFTFIAAGCGYVKGISAQETEITLTGLTGESSRYNLAEKITITPDNAKNKNLIYASSNPDIVTVSEAGILQAVSVGSSKITVKSADKKGESLVVNVTVNPILVTSVYAGATEVTITDIGEQLNIAGRFSVLPSSATDKSLTYTSSNTGVVTVNSNGVLTSVAIGTTTVKATANDGSEKYAQITVHVRGKLVTSVVADIYRIVIIGTGEQHNIADDFTVLPLDAPNRTLSYASSNTSVVTVSSNGMLTSVASGSATVTATATDGSGQYAQITVHVEGGEEKIADGIYVTFVSVGGSGIGIFGVLLREDMTYSTYGFNGALMDLISIKLEETTPLETGIYTVDEATVTFTPSTGTTYTAVLQEGVSLSGSFNFYGTTKDMQMQYMIEDDLDEYTIFAEAANWSSTWWTSQKLGNHVLLIFGNQFILAEVDDIKKITDDDDATMPEVVFAATGTVEVSGKTYTFTYTDGYAATTINYGSLGSVLFTLYGFKDGQFVYNAQGSKQKITFVDATDFI